MSGHHIGERLAGALLAASLTLAPAMAQDDGMRAWSDRVLEIGEWTALGQDDNSVLLGKVDGPTGETGVIAASQRQEYRAAEVNDGFNTRSMLMRLEVRCATQEVRSMGGLYYADNNLKGAQRAFGRSAWIAALPTSAGGRLVLLACDGATRAPEPS